MIGYYTPEGIKAKRAGELSDEELARFKEDRARSAGRHAVNLLGGVPAQMILAGYRSSKDQALAMERAAEDMGNIERPEYQIPDATRTALSEASRLYNADRTRSEGVLADRVQQGMANVVSAASKFGNAGDVLNAVSRGQAAANDSMQNIALNSEARRERNFGMYQQALANMANEETAQWMYNKYQPYYDKLNEQREYQRNAMMMQQQAANQLTDIGMEGAKLAASLASAGLTSGAIGSGGGGGGSFNLGGGGYNYNFKGKADPIDPSNVVNYDTIFDWEEGK